MFPRRVDVRRVLEPMSVGSSRPVRVDTAFGTFILKLVGGAEGPLPLAAEWICTSLAALLGLPALELVAIELSASQASSVRDVELREALQRGAGTCLGSRELAGATLAKSSELAAADDDFAIRLLWLDGIVENPDRRPENPNVLRWGSSLVPIDYGSALSFHHDGDLSEQRPWSAPVTPLRHIYAARASRLFDFHGELRKRLTRERLDAICAGVPREWLGPLIFATPERQRAVYAAYVWKRLQRFDRALTAHA